MNKIVENFGKIARQTSKIRTVEKPGDIRLADSSAKPTAHLITTKLNMPALGARMVEREHLLERLSAGREARLVVISGVAASGKTSLACEWIKRDKLVAAWYSLDRTDNEPGVFFQYLLAAIDKVGGSPSAFDDRLPHNADSLVGRTVASYLINRLIGLSHDVYLVLDDYHFITSRDIHDTLLYFLNRAPARVHVVITSRYAIPFSLSQFKIRNQLTEITAPEMRFLEQEVLEFFADVIPLRLSPEEARQVLHYTEGWVGGLQLFALSQKGRAVSHGLSAALRKVNQEATEYLVNEVIKAQPGRLREFLLTTALLDRFNVDICKEITGTADARELLDRIHRNNIFLVPLDNEGRWYRYHHLFSEAVATKLRVSSADRVADTYRRAAKWFARNGLLEDAFRHAFASEDYEFAADMLEDHLMALYDRYEIASFRQWLARLPYETFKQRTLLRLLECRLNVESVKLLEAGSLLSELESRKEDAFARYEGFKRQLCEDHLLLFKCILPFWTDPLKVRIEDLKDALSRVSPENMVFPGMIKIMIGSSYLFQGDVLRAGETAREASGTFSSSESILVRMLWIRLMAATERLKGHLHVAADTLEKGFELLERMGGRHVPASYVLHSAIAWVHYMRNDLNKASEHVSKTLSLLEAAGSIWESIETRFLAALTHIARSEFEKADVQEERIRTTALSSGNPYMVAFAKAFCAQLSLSRGNLEEAERWAEERKLRPDEPFSYLFVHECFTVGQLLCEKGCYTEAFDLLEVFRGRCREQGFAEMLLRSDLLFCRVLHALHRHEQAREIMADLLAFSEKEGYVRPFLNHAKHISPILLSIARRSRRFRQRPFMKRILETCGIDWEREVSRSRPSDGNAGLTRREIEILKLLAAGYTYREISDKACVSIDTVRTHIRHIFEKLQVKARAHAVQRAEALGII
jgi:LuxR family maltose regulon positive regulatory protein